MLQVIGKDNRHYKAAVRVRNGKEKRLVFVEGRRLALEAVRSRLKIIDAFFSADYLAGGPDALVAAVTDRAGNCFELPNKLFNSLAETRTPQGVALICERREYSLEDLFRRKEEGSFTVPAIVVLDRISNPGNLGAVMRTAEAAGAIGIVTTAGSADAFSPVALRGSMGASFRFPVAEKQDLGDVIGKMKDAGFRVAATASGGNEPLYAVDWSVPTAIVFGSEAHGIGEGADSLSDMMVAIPMEDAAESLNLAVAAGVVLFEARRFVTAGSGSSS